MKMIFAIVQGEDAGHTVQALTNAGMPVTRLQSSGGFLQQGNATLMIAIDDGRVDKALEIIRENCRERSQFMTSVSPLVETGEFMVPYPVEVQVGGATVFVVNVEQYEKL